jgi:hypothetical protein
LDEAKPQKPIRVEVSGTLFEGRNVLGFQRDEDLPNTAGVSKSAEDETALLRLLQWKGENNLYAMGTRLDRAHAQTDLAARARSYLVPAEAVGNTQSKQELVAGDAPLTPIQRWFFEQHLKEPQHYNQAFLFEVKEQLDQPLLERALGELALHHDALRLRYTPLPDGWRQFHSDPACSALAEVLARSTRSS